MFLQQIDEINKHLTNIALLNVWSHKTEMCSIIRSATNMENFASGVKHFKNQYCY